MIRYFWKIEIFLFSEMKVVEGGEMSWFLDGMEAADFVESRGAKISRKTYL